MRDLANQGINLIKPLANRLRTPASIDAYVRSVFRYESEPVETLCTVQFMVDSISKYGYFVGDCDDVSIFLASLLKSLGYRVKFVAIATKRNDPNFYHVFTDVMISGQWFRFDPTVSSGTTHIYYKEMIVNV